MNRIPVLLLFLSLTIALTGQAPFPTSTEIKDFTGSTTCVVLESGNSPYNVFVRRAMEEYWKITPYEFVSSSVFEDRRDDPAFSFIVLTETSFERDRSKTAYNFINLLQGKDVEEMDQMPEICAVPLSLAGVDDLEYGYKLGAILSFIQKHARMISKDPSLTGRRYLRYYNRNIPQISQKTILVKKEDLSPSVNSAEKIQAFYKNRIEIVAEDAIIEAIHEKLPNTLILHLVGPAGGTSTGYCFKMLIGTDDSDMYYYNQHLIDKTNPNGLLPADLKRFGRF
ncbi:MAG: hypothetical protein GYA41_02995 [Bacteroidales bacterium]|nr:hypothetical protein [Bacteroidales bacterium]